MTPRKCSTGLFYVAKCTHWQFFHKGYIGAFVCHYRIIDASFETVQEAVFHSLADACKKFCHCRIWHIGHVSLYSFNLIFPFSICKLIRPSNVWGTWCLTRIYWDRMSLFIISRLVSFLFFLPDSYKQFYSISMSFCWLRKCPLFSIAARCHSVFSWFPMRVVAFAQLVKERVNHAPFA